MARSKPATATIGTSRSERLETRVYVLYSGGVARWRDRLADWSREELVDLVERMIHREPDLVAMLDTPPPGRAATVSAEEIDRQIDIAFGPAVRGGWRESFAVARAMEDLAALARSFLARGEAENAVVAFAAVSAGIRARYASIHDEESNVGRVLDACVDGLEACLGAAAGELRRDALRAILELAVWDYASGGFGVGERAPDVVLARATTEERHVLAAVVEPYVHDARTEYGRQRLGRLLVRLRGDDLSDESRLALLLESGNHHARIERLLELHRPRDAAEALAGIESWSELVAGADLFIAAGYADHAHEVLEKTVGSRRSQGRWLVLEWLARRPPRRHDPFGATWAEELFVEQPTVERWLQLRTVTKEHRRVQLRHKLADEGKHLLLIEILLAENKAREALAKFRRVKDRSEPALRAMVRIADGVAARKSRDAAALYAQVAHAYAARGHPEEYDIAVDLIRRGRAALRAAGHVVLAKRYVDDFRQRHTRRPALIQRLDVVAAE